MSEEKIEFKCCYCKGVFPGKARFCIPEGYPNRKVHENKPLCNGCGQHKEPSLDKICEALDKELKAASSLGPTIQLFRTTLLDLLDAERVVVLSDLRICLYCGQDIECRPCTCMRDE